MVSRELRWVWGLTVCCAGGGPVGAAMTPAGPGTFQVPLEAQVLDPTGREPTVAEVTGGSLDEHFRPFRSRGSHLIKATLWFRLPPPGPALGGETPVLLARSGMDQPVEIFARRPAIRLSSATFSRSSTDVSAWRS